MYNDDGNNNGGSSSNKGGSIVKLLIIVLLLVAVAVAVYFFFFREDNSDVTVKIVNNPLYVSLSDQKKIEVKINNEAYSGNLDWNSSDEEIVSISQTGVATAHKLGEVTVTATYKKKDKSFKDTGKIIVYTGQEGVEVEDIVVPEGDLTLNNSGTYDLGNDIEITPNDGYITKKEYISSNPEVVTVDENGLITVVSVGESEITINVNDTYNKVIKVVVSEENGNSGFQKKPEKITFTDGTSIKLKEQELKKLNVEIEPVGASKGHLTWKSSDDTILTVDDNGNILGTKEGTATVTVTCENGVSASINVEVEALKKDVEKIEFNQTGVFLDTNNQAQLSINKGDTFIVTPVVTPNNATNKELTFDIKDSSIVTITPNPEKSAVTIVALKKGETLLTAKSSNGVTATLKIIVETTGGGGISGSCYCNGSISNCAWASGPYDDYTQRQSRIPNPNACILYASGGLCFRDSSGKHHFGKLGNNSSYTYVAGAQNRETCVALDNSEAGKEKTATLTCNSAVVNGKGRCNFSTTIQPYTLRSATSSDTEIAKVEVAGSVVSVTCKKEGTVTITAVPSNGMSEVRDSFRCYSSSDFNINCPTSVGVNQYVYISGPDGIGIKCSTSSTDATVSNISNGRCSVKGVNANKTVTVTVTSSENSSLSKTCRINVTETLPKDAVATCVKDLKYTGSSQTLASCTNCRINGTDKAVGSADRDTTITVTAIANEGHLFSNGDRTRTIECTIKKQ